MPAPVASPSQQAAVQAKSGRAERHRREKREGRGGNVGIGFGDEVQSESAKRQVNEARDDRAERKGKHRPAYWAKWGSTRELRSANGTFDQSRPPSNLGQIIGRSTPWQAESHRKRRLWPIGGRSYSNVEKQELTANRNTAEPSILPIADTQVLKVFWFASKMK